MRYDAAGVRDEAAYEPPQLSVPIDVAPGRTWDETYVLRGRRRIRHCEVSPLTACDGGVGITCTLVGEHVVSTNRFCPGVGYVGAELVATDEAGTLQLDVVQEVTARRNPVPP